MPRLLLVGLLATIGCADMASVRDPATGRVTWHCVVDGCLSARRYALEQELTWIDGYCGVDAGCRMDRRNAAILRYDAETGGDHPPPQPVVRSGGSATVWVVPPAHRFGAVEPARPVQMWW
jgi:hypothetical protein